MQAVQTRKAWGMNVNTYCMWMHISQFLGFILSIFVIIIPLTLWLANRDEHTEIDAHGKSVINWLLSITLYFVAGIILIFLLPAVASIFGSEAFGIAAFITSGISYLGMTLLVLLGLIFPIIGIIKAYSGKPWNYPFSIKFLK